MKRLCLALALLVMAFPAGSVALVQYDKGARTINGVQLLQDAFDENVYYYLPQYPRLATKDDGETLEFLCVKYVGQEDDGNGGLFHALIEFTLPDAEVAALEAALEKELPNAELRGPVQLLQAGEDGAEGVGGFRIVSATLSDTEPGGFARSVISSGRAPLTPGSKAVIAAMLSPEGATVLFDSLSAPTSDVSIALTAYYEAKVEGYSAHVSAETEAVYKHYSRVGNMQKRFTKRELRQITDSMVRSGDIKVEVFDRSDSLDMDASGMQSLLDLVTSKMTDLMFDATTGWTAAPAKEVAVGSNQIRGRQERGIVAKWFAGEGNPEYITDNQYVLKNRTDIQRNTFNVYLNQSTSIKIPVDTAGNLGGLYEGLKEDDRYFRVVNLVDPAFERRNVQFQVDGEYLDSFSDTVNFVAVNFRKPSKGNPTVSKSLLFTNEDILSGRAMKEVWYPRLDDGTDEWRDFEYQVRWSVRDRPTLMVPKQEDEWLKSRDSAISLVPPFQKRTIEVETDLDLLAESGIVTAILEFAAPLAGKNKLQRKATIRYTDADPARTVSLYHDRDEPVAWRVTWYTPEGSVKSAPAGLNSEYLFLVPPAIIPGGE